MNNIIANIRTQLQKLKCRIANLSNRVTYIEDNCCNGGGDMPDVSATERGVVNNEPLQELGGVDKLINGIRIGRGEGNYSSSVVLGRVALASNTTGNHNVAVGNQALRNNTSGSENTTLGANSGRDITTGSRNTLIGTWAGYTSKTASDNVSIGYAAGGREFEEPTGGRNVSLGANAASFLSSGASNISIGHRSANALRTGSHNIMIGAQSGDKTNSTLPPAATWDFGDRNIFIGRLAGLWAVPNLAEDYLLIHSYNNQSGENKTPLILGHFTDRFLKVGGVLELDPQFLPIPDATFTKKLVYNPTDGKVTAVDDTSGGIQSIVPGDNISVDNTDPLNPIVSATGGGTTGEYIPLSGTEVGKPVTGPVTIGEETGDRAFLTSFGIYGYSDSNNFRYTLSGDGVAVADIIGGNGFGINSKGIIISESLNLDGGKVDDQYNKIGLRYEEDYSSNFNERSLIDKSYADQQHSYSTSETKTGGTWIDGKPIYRKTVVFTNSELVGSIIDLSLYFSNVESITPDTSIFTDWTSDNGLKSFGQIVSNTLHYHLTPQSLKATNFDDSVDFDLSLLDSITLTLSFTKTTD